MQGLKAGIKAGIIPGRVGNGDNPCVVIILSFGCNRGRIECRPCPRTLPDKLCKVFRGQEIEV